ncbi:hypothetical protein PCANC_10925 [Puccinia coronata f. sp. avenae]|uniref:Core-binding (CB) domain-containing protein n=1 Tax=Puccinia coronata f. sp. avenae TaxID=200324 RepID=A0A2N5T008_9BASI|nr:hypothetical protein PCANC_10925 [Puccinia coronata f. sp. avenae]
MDLNRIQVFLKDGTSPKNPSAQDKHVLRGYQWNTLLSYNAAAKKLFQSMAAKGVESFELPLSREDIYDFCHWAGREEDQANPQDVSAKKIQKYLYGLKAWHLYHKRDYPHTSEARVVVMLRASLKEEAATPANEKKNAITLRNLVLLAQYLIQKGEKGRAVLDLALVAFWEMVRLGEITYQSKS